MDGGEEPSQLGSLVLGFSTYRAISCGDIKFYNCLSPLDDETFVFVVIKQVRLALTSLLAHVTGLFSCTTLSLYWCLCL